MRNLYLLNASDRELAGLASPGSALVLLEDAVYLLIDPDFAGALSSRGIDVYVLEADARERGLEEALPPSEQRVDYTELVRLVMSKDYKVINL